MPFLFPYLVGGAVAYILFAKKQKPCAPCDDATGMAPASDATGAACRIPDDVVCLLTRLAFQAKDKAALLKLESWVQAGAVTKEQLAACMPAGATFAP